MFAELSGQSPATVVRLGQSVIFGAQLWPPIPRERGGRRG
jgi:hypothetical protein